MDVLFITAETSGDRHSAPVVAALCERGLRVSVVGGQAMADAGAELILNSAAWGALGVPDALRKLPQMLRFRAEIANIALRRKPSVVVLVDAGAFNVRMAERLMHLADRPRILYYFPPGSWRQHPRDWSHLAAVTDCIATPFEKNAEYLRASGADAHWVGHPALDELKPVTDRVALREDLGIPPGRPVIGIMPGSRASERSIIGRLMNDARRIIQAALPQATFLWSTLPDQRLRTPTDDQARAQDSVTCLDDSRTVLRAADFVLLAMGTATLEAAAAGTPFIGVYEHTFLSKFIATYLLRQRQPMYAMPNILLGRKAVPEIVPASPWDRITGQRIAAEALGVLQDQGRMEALREDLATARGKLGEPGAARRTADLIEALARRQSCMETE